jgi:hypothetical protein
MLCKKCGIEFLPSPRSGSVKLYCSERCRHSAEISRYRERYPERTHHLKDENRNKKQFIPWILEKVKSIKKPEISRPAPKQSTAMSIEETRKRQAAHGREMRKGKSYAGVRARKKEADPIYSVKESARAKLRNAVKRGEIIKSKKCERCGTEGILEGHHYRGYDYPLTVIWLCHVCHSLAHQLNPPPLSRGV